MIHPKEYIYLTLHLEISVVKYRRSKGRVLRDWVLIYNLLVYLLVSKKTKKKDESEESFNMSQKEEQFGDKVVKTMAPLVFFLAKIVH